MAVQILSGVAGISMWLMPNGDSASQTALIVAAIDPTVPASPMPFAPTGLTIVGTARVAKVKPGKSSARGMV
jgi:hypothetical protein